MSSTHARSPGAALAARRWPPRSLAVIAAHVHAATGIAFATDGQRQLLRLAELIATLRESRRLDALVVTTSWRPEDDAVAEAAECEGVPCLRAPRRRGAAPLVDAANMIGARRVVRVDAELACPDARWVDLLLDGLDAFDASYAGFISGQGLEALRVEALLAAYRAPPDLDSRDDPFAHVRDRPLAYATILFAPPCGPTSLQTRAKTVGAGAGL